MPSAPVTPILFVGDSLHLEHVATSDVAEAIALVGQGTTVLVPTFDIAEAVIRHYGAREDHIAWTRSLLAEPRVQGASTDTTAVGHLAHPVDE